MIARSFRLLGRWAATLGALAYTGAASAAAGVPADSAAAGALDLRRQRCRGS